MDPRLNFVTLAVRDLARTRDFYVTGLGWPVTFEAAGEVVMIPLGEGLVLSLWARHEFEVEVGTPASGLAPITLAHNVSSPAEVDAVLHTASRAGATAVEPGTVRDWGGYSGYFADPDGFRWEVAHNPSPMGDELVAASRRWWAGQSGRTR
ncbi:VOC family protein [Mariniluteicoccus flavus]